MLFAVPPSVQPSPSPNDSSPVPGLARRWCRARIEALRSVAALAEPQPGQPSEHALLALA
ncbi:MAG: hypothetical protein EXR69_04310 [Myxococcales bacterium]|nr:hypothetical protein [Myxococcales bacterium]